MTAKISARRIAMAIAVALSWASMVAHNLYELPITITALPNTGPLAFVLALLAAYIALPASRIPAAALLVWGALNFLVGGIITVFPLSFLPFEPEQSVSHYIAHVVYSVGQLPLLYVAFRDITRPRDRLRD